MIYSDLKAKRILVIGASTGIGENLVTYLCNLGVDTIVATSNPEKTSENFKSFNNISVFPINFDETGSIDQLADDIPEVDGLAIISGITKVVPPHMMSIQMVHRQIDFNLTKPIYLISKLLNKRKIRNTASIILTSASARINQAPCSTTYAAAKLGIYGAARSFSADLSAKKIRVNCVSFDYVSSEMTENIKFSGVDQIIGVSPLENTALPYLFLLSERSRWMTGQMLAADAGRMLGKTRYV